MGTTKHQDALAFTLTGRWWDEFYERDPDGSLRLVHKTEVMSNARMDAALILISAFFQNDVAITGGILYHAQGRGDGAWTTPPAVVTSNTTLMDEADRRAPDSIVFLDAFDVPTLTRTTKIKISTTYDLADLAGETLREQALFGGDATATPDSGLIINTINHGPLYKSGASVLVRNITLQFS